MEFTSFGQYLLTAQSPQPNISYQSWCVLSDFTKQNFDIFMNYFLEILQNTEFPSNSKKFALILFNRLFQSEDSNFAINPDIFPNLIQIVLSMFSSNDIELAGLSAELLSNLSILELQDDENCPLISAYAQSLASVSTPSEIYGFSTLLSDICSIFKTNEDEQNMIMTAVLHHLSNQNNENYIKIKLLQISCSIIGQTENRQMIEALAAELINQMNNSSIYSELFNCWSQIVSDFPEFTPFVLQNISQIAINSLENIEAQSSILYFFNSLLCEETAQYFSNLVTLFFPILFKIIAEDEKSFENDATNFLENLIILTSSVYLSPLSGNPIAFIHTIPNGNDYIILIAFCALAKMKITFDLNFIFPKISSQIPRERYMAIRCIKIITKNKQLLDAVNECLLHTSDLIDIQYQVVRLINVLLEVENFPIHNYFDFLLINTMNENPIICSVSFDVLKKSLSFMNQDQIILFTSKILEYFEKCLQNQVLHSNLIKLSTIIQKIAMKLKKSFLPFAKQSQNLLNLMAKIDFDYFIETLLPIVIIAYETENVILLEQICQTEIQILQKNYENDDIVNSVITSFFYIFQLVNIEPYLSVIIPLYFTIFQQTKNLQVLSGFNDVLDSNQEIVKTEFPNLTNLVLQTIEILGNEKIESYEIDYNEKKQTIFNDLSDVILYLVKYSPQSCLIQAAFQYLMILEQQFDDLDSFSFSIIEMIYTLCIIQKDEVYSFLQSYPKIKEMIMEGLNDPNSHDYSQRIISIYGVELF
ncbi:hypothetical protein TRFO_27453 [Tritrichomonas foetus]|uniref:Importin N-terminal domain-containing protein n=1 Tax=Tritrichomonas foetus TaxID=1144522 RepID=A0A1J4K654_9EUKA|nr:hypothetical protein TRFO_27453 [Tritrichomonas foetus]|eukprot:OHT04949.1 hypothetical protein TRFO_27453 [Tritrichomonas foetus]